MHLSLVALLAGAASAARYRIDDLLLHSVVQDIEVLEYGFPILGDVEYVQLRAQSAAASADAVLSIVAAPHPPGGFASLAHTCDTNGLAQFNPSVVPVARYDYQLGLDTHRLKIPLEGTWINTPTITTLLIAICGADNVTSFTASGVSLDVLYSNGGLEDTFYNEIWILFLLLIFKASVTGWYMHKNKVWAEFVSTQQTTWKNLLFCDLFLSTWLFFLYVRHNNDYTTDSFFTIQVDDVFLRTLFEAALEVATDVFVISSAMGRGVVVPDLTPAQRRKIGYYLAAYAVAALTRLATRSGFLQLTLAIVFWVWFFKEVAASREGVELAQRHDCEAKLVFFKKLRSIGVYVLVGACVMWLMLITVIVSQLAVGHHLAFPILALPRLYANAVECLE